MSSLSLVALLINPPVSRYLGVNMAALALIQVDLHLDVLDLARLFFELCLELEFESLHFAFLLVVLVDEDSLIGVIQLLVFFLLAFGHLSDHIEEVGVLLDAAGQMSLSSLQLAILVFDGTNT